MATVPTRAAAVFDLCRDLFLAGLRYGDYLAAVAGILAVMARYRWRRQRMRYIMRERILSWGDDFTIKDPEGRDVYYVDGKVFSFGDKLSFRDNSGNELVVIDQKLLSLGPQYEIIRGGETVAVVKKHLFSLLRARFTVDVPGPDDLEATGNFLDHEYAFERGGREVARASKKWLTLADTYAIDIDEDEDPVVILAAAVVIDLVSHPDPKNHRG